MELYETLVKRTIRKDVPWQRFAVFPLGDIQLGSDGCAEDELRQWVKRCLRLDGKFFGMGDYCDVMSPSNRVRFNSANLYDTTVAAMEDSARRHIERLLNILHGTEGKWLGLLEGHHYVNFADGTTTDTRLARALKTEFLGDCAIVRLSFNYTKNPNGPRRSLKLTFWAHHGEGGGVTQGAPLNKLERVALGWPRVDCFLLGHYHRKGVFDLPPGMDMTDHPPYRLIASERKAILTGAWLRGYVEGQKQAGGSRAGGLYPEQKMLAPLPIGAPIVWIEPRYRQSGAYISVRGES